LSALSHFKSLEILVLDKNNVSNLHTCPPMPSLKDLSCNNNAVFDCMEFLMEVSEKFPALHHLSIMRNPGVPDPLDDDMIQLLYGKESWTESAEDGKNAICMDHLLSCDGAGDNAAGDKVAGSAEENVLVPPSVGETNVALGSSSPLLKLSVPSEDQEHAPHIPTAFCRTPTDTDIQLSAASPTQLQSQEAAVSESGKNGFPFSIFATPISAASATNTPTRISSEGEVNKRSPEFRSCAVEGQRSARPVSPAKGLRKITSDQRIQLTTEDIMFRFRAAVCNIVPTLTWLDGTPISYEEKAAALDVTCKGSDDAGRSGDGVLDILVRLQQLHRPKSVKCSSEANFKLSEEWEWPAGYTPSDLLLKDDEKLAKMEILQKELDSHGARALAAKTFWDLNKKGLLRYLEGTVDWSYRYVSFTSGCVGE
jgi:hypothetical protein